ncbi:MAG: tRNA nuclease CdiA-2 [Pseudomonas sp.]|nr:MAG: tRNA nuclease CdiA-2 [Pseudomonas sp.]
MSVDARDVDNSAQGQLLAAAGGLSLNADSLDNRAGLILAQAGHAELALGQGSVDNRGGSVQGDSLAVTAVSLDNRAGDAASGTLAGQIASLVGDLRLQVSRLLNQGGQLTAKTDLELTGSELDNRDGGQVSAASLDLQLDDALRNDAGLIEAERDLTLNAASLDNGNGGQLRALAGSASHIGVSGQLDNQGGSIAVGSEAFTLSADALLNGGGEVQHAGTGLFSLQLQRLSGSRGTLLGSGAGNWQLGSVDGLGQAQLNGALTLDVRQALILASGDRLASSGALSVQADSLQNAGELLTDADLSVDASGAVSNSGLFSAQQALRIGAASLAQADGRLASGGDMTLTLSGTLDNLGRLIANQGLNVSAA